MPNLHWNHDYNCTNCGNGWTEIADHEMQGDEGTMPCPFCHSADQSPTHVYDTQLLDNRLHTIRKNDEIFPEMDIIPDGSSWSDETIPW